MFQLPERTDEHTPRDERLDESGPLPGAPQDVYALAGLKFLDAPRPRRVTRPLDAEPLRIERLVRLEEVREIARRFRVAAGSH